MRLTKDASLSTQLWKAIFLPIILIVTLSTLFIAFYQVSEQKQQFEQLNRHQTQQIASSSEFALLFNDKNLINSNIQTLLKQPNIIGVTYYNSKSEIIENVGQTLTDNSQPLPRSLSSQYHDERNLFVVTTPIYYNSNNKTVGGDMSFNGNVNLLADAIGLTQSSQLELLGWVQVSANTQQLKLSRIMTLFYCAIFFFITAFLCAYVSRWFAKRIAAPWITITQTVRNIAGEYFDSVNSLILPDRLKNTGEDLALIAERLRNYQTKLDADIEEFTKEARENAILLEEKSAQLYIANKEATENNRLKSQFLANISHEVRTPLNAILGYTKLLQKDSLNSQQKSHVDTIEQSTNDLLATIGNILDFSKIEAGKKVVLSSDDFSIREVIDDVLLSLASTITTENKDIDLVSFCDESLPMWSKGDKTRLRQILTNLVGNAIKFTKKGHIHVVARCNDINSSQQQIIRIEVIDTGCGIRSDALHQLFKPFSQVDNSHTRSYSGTGLGLVITQKIIEQMNGQIHVSSEYGFGSNFYFDVTLSESEKSSASLGPLNQTLLVLENSKSYREYLKSFFKQHACQYDFASSLEQFISYLKKPQTKYTAALIAVGHTEKEANDAYELGQYLSKHLHIPFIYLTRATSYLSLHANDFEASKHLLQKPLTTTKLHQFLARATAIESAQTEQAPLASINTDRLKDLHVLAVDDTPINLQLLGHWLEPHQIKLSLAYSGQDAIDMCQKQVFDLILMDIQMPQMDGIETTKQLRTMENYQDIPIIALTAHALVSEQQSILSSGMNAYLTKPINEETLLSTLDKWCKTNTNFKQQIDVELANVFDLSKAITMSGNRPQAAQDLFEMLMQSIQEDKRVLMHHFEQQDLEKLISTVHRIHGASKYSGTIEVTKHANFLETHLKELGFDEVEEVYDDFMQSIDHLEQVQNLIPWPQASQTQAQTDAHPID